MTCLYTEDDKNKKGYLRIDLYKVLNIVDRLRHSL